MARFSNPARGFGAGSDVSGNEIAGAKRLSQVINLLYTARASGARRRLPRRLSFLRRHAGQGAGQGGRGGRASTRQAIRGQRMSGLTTHILDQAAGKPAAGVVVRVSRREDLQVTP